MQWWIERDLRRRRGIGWEGLMGRRKGSAVGRAYGQSWLHAVVEAATLVAEDEQPHGKEGGRALH